MTIVVRAVETIALPTSAVPVTAASFFEALAQGPVAEDVFRNDDRAVVEHAHPCCQAAERHQIEGEAAEIHQAERPDNRDRDNGVDDERRFPFLKEQKENEKASRAPWMISFLTAPIAVSSMKPARSSAATWIPIPGFSFRISRKTFRAAFVALTVLAPASFRNLEADALLPVPPGDPVPFLWRTSRTAATGLRDV